MSFCLFSVLEGKVCGFCFVFALHLYRLELNDLNLGFCMYMPPSF